MHFNALRIHTHYAMHSSVEYIYTCVCVSVWTVHMRDTQINACLHCIQIDRCATVRHASLAVTLNICSNMFNINFRFILLWFLLVICTDWFTDTKSCLDYKLCRTKSTGSCLMCNSQFISIFIKQKKYIPGQFDFALNYNTDIQYKFRIMLKK